MLGFTSPYLCFMMGSGLVRFLLLDIHYDNYYDIPKICSYDINISLDHDIMSYHCMISAWWRHCLKSPTMLLLQRPLG